jgi:hypothetical protein
VIDVIAGHVPRGSAGWASRTQAAIERIETNAADAKAIDAGDATRARMSQFYDVRQAFQASPPLPM